MPSTTSATHTLLISLILILLIPTSIAVPALSITPRSVTSTSKAGLAWGGSPGEMQQYTTTGKVSWSVHPPPPSFRVSLTTYRYYTWSPDAAANASLEFAPMLWGQREVDDFAATINGTIQAGGVTAVLGMNESVHHSHL